jgi:hypothetical protein
VSGVQLWLVMNTTIDIHLKESLNADFVVLLDTFHHEPQFLKSLNCIGENTFLFDWQTSPETRFDDLVQGLEEQKLVGKLAFEVLLSHLQTERNWYLPTSPIVIEVTCRFAKFFQLSGLKVLENSVTHSLRSSYPVSREDSSSFWRLSSKHRSESVLLSNFGMVATKENDHGHRFVIGDKLLSFAKAQDSQEYCWEVRILKIGDASLSYNFIMLGVCDHIPGFKQSHLDSGCWGFASNSRIYRNGMIYDGEINIAEQDVLQFILKLSVSSDSKRNISLTLFNLSKSAQFQIEGIIEPNGGENSGFYPYMNILAANAKIIISPIQHSVVGSIVTSEELQFDDEVFYSL